MPRKLTQEEVIAKFLTVHGYKYDYSKVEYKGYEEDVIIICPIHGEFTQTPHDHLSGCGCPECGGRVKKDNERFIKEAIAVHGEYYDYSKVEYVNKDTDVKIICPIHGEFEQRPSNHLRGQGCSKCGRLRVKQKLTHSQEWWVAAIAKVNPNVEILGEIVNGDTPVLCRCKICGHKWRPRPTNLQYRHGCPECKKLALSIIHTKTHEEWVEDIAKINPAIEILGKIVNGTTPVPCRCRVCGYKWEPKPAWLEQGNGCHKCAKSGFLSHEQGHLYIMVDDSEVPTMMKVGVSINTEKRKNEVLKSAKKAGAGIINLHVIKTWCGLTENMHSLEQAVHKALGEYKINFPVKFDGCQEFFYYRPEVFELIEEHLKKFTTEE